MAHGVGTGADVLPMSSRSASSEPDEVLSAEGSAFSGWSVGSWVLQ